MEIKAHDALTVLRMYVEFREQLRDLAVELERRTAHRERLRTVLFEILETTDVFPVLRQRAVEALRLERCNVSSDV